MNYRKPLAIRMRPETLSDIAGQSHILGEGKYITTMCKTKQYRNLIFFGKPGTGKTTIANVIAKESGMPTAFFNAVQGAKKDLDAIFKQSETEGPMMLIIDEIHRLNKDKQDLLLPHLENGNIVCMGLTTSNPLFAVNPAIRSRCLLFEIKTPSVEEVVEILQKGLKMNEEETGISVKCENDILKEVAQKNNCDVRASLNTLEALLAYNSSEITSEMLANTLQVSGSASLGDEETHYNLLSAFQKSIRGSDVDAALYYLAQLLAIGDLITIERRLLVIAYEDIGLAAPEVVGRVNAATEAAKKVGIPEASLILAEIVCELALSKKSKAAHDAIKRAETSVASHIYEQPEYLKLHPVGLSKADSYDYSNNQLWKFIQYLPEEIKNERFLIMTGREDSELLGNYQKLSTIKRTSDLKYLKGKMNGR